MIAVEGDDSISRRLRDTGVVPDARIEVVRRALWGDPTQYHLHGFRLALRGAQASRIRVRLPEASDD